MASDLVTDAPRRSVAATIGWYLALGAISVVVLFPIWMTAVFALSNPSKLLLGQAKLWPVDRQDDVFSKAWEGVAGGLGRHLLISLLVTLLTVVLQVTTSVLAAYAFAFLRFPFKRTLFALTIATLLLPIEVTLLTNLDTVQSLGWIGIEQDFTGAIASLVVPFGATALGIFLLRQGFAGIPGDLRDAATLDGWGHLGFIRHVALPVARPVVASFVVISFLDSYNQYTWPRMAGFKEAYYTAQIAVSGIVETGIDQANIAFAAALIISVPVLVLLIGFQRHIVAGLTAGAVKG